MCCNGFLWLENCRVAGQSVRAPSKISNYSYYRLFILFCSRSCTNRLLTITCTFTTLIPHLYIIFNLKTYITSTFTLTYIPVLYFNTTCIVYQLYQVFPLFMFGINLTFNIKSEYHIFLLNIRCESRFYE